MHIVEHGVIAGKRVHLSAGTLHRARNRKGIWPIRAAFECHVLQKVRHAVRVSRLKARAKTHSYCKTDTHHAGHWPHNAWYTIGNPKPMQFHRAPPSFFPATVLPVIMRIRLWRKFSRWE